jgi:hypothetical protein
VSLASNNSIHLGFEVVSEGRNTSLGVYLEAVAGLSDDLTRKHVHPREAFAALPLGCGLGLPMTHDHLLQDVNLSPMAHDSSFNMAAFSASVANIAKELSRSSGLSKLRIPINRSDVGS